MLETALNLIGGEQPWWVWAIAALIPLCVAVFMRELVCWFFKTNKLLRRLEKLEKRVNGLQLANADVSLGKKRKSAPPAEKSSTASTATEAS